ncbi:MAG: hypothetical protein U0797_23185 [Gemmataceae bacterium]
MPEAAPSAPFLPEGAGVIAEGISVGLSTLEQALRSLLEPEASTAWGGPLLMHWVGVSLWSLAAAFGVAVACGYRPEPAGLDVEPRRVGPTEEEQP